MLGNLPGLGRAVGEGDRGEVGEAGGEEYLNGRVKGVWSAWIWVHGRPRMLACRGPGVGTSGRVCEIVVG